MRGRVPSRTATKIARFMLLMDAEPRLRGVLPKDAAATAEAVLRSSGVVRARHIDSMRKPSTLRLASWAERLTGRGQLLWFAVRKRWMADQVEAAIAAGARQLLVVGSGFDPLASVMARRHPDVLCVEVDAPVTAEPKRAGVEGAGLTRPNHHVCAADLSQRSLGEVLRATPWRNDARSIVVAEGLLMYLHREDVGRFFANVREVTAVGSRVAFSSLDADEKGRPHIGALDAPIRLTLKLMGEAMHWGLRPGDAPAFLAAAGYRTLEQPTPETLRQTILEPRSLRDEPLRAYEHLVLAETADGVAFR